MAQFDVFINPIVAARGAYPFVVVMQSNFAATPSDQIVAPMTRRSAMANRGGGGPLTPVVDLKGTEHVVFVPRMTTLRSRDLLNSAGSIATARSQLLSAVDYLFFGI